MSIAVIAKDIAAMQAPLTNTLQVDKRQITKDTVDQVTDLQVQTGYLFNSVSKALQKVGYQTRLIGEGTTGPVCPTDGGGTPGGITLPPPAGGDARIKNGLETPAIYLPELQKMVNTLHLHDVFNPGELATADQELNDVYTNYGVLSRKFITVYTSIPLSLTSKGTVTPSQPDLSALTATGPSGDNPKGGSPLTTSGPTVFADKTVSEPASAYQVIVNESTRIAKVLDTAIKNSRPKTIITVKPDKSNDVTPLPVDTGNPTQDALTDFHLKSLQELASSSTTDANIDLNVFHSVNTNQPIAASSLTDAWTQLKGVTLNAARELTISGLKTAAFQRAAISDQVSQISRSIDLAGGQTSGIKATTLSTFNATVNTFVKTYQKQLSDLSSAGQPVLPDQSFNPNNPGGGAAFAKLQVGNLYLQARGSDNNDGLTKDAKGNLLDGSNPGIHLRWAFRGDLRDHLPKGHAYPSYPTPGNPLNHANDFVHLFRTDYKNRAYIHWDPNKVAPKSKQVFATYAIWTYECDMFQEYNGGIVDRGTSSVFVRFGNMDAYNKAKEGRSDPETLQQYCNYDNANTPLEIGVAGKLSFSISVKYYNSRNSFDSKRIQIEGVAVYDEVPNAERVINFRQIIPDFSPNCDTSTKIIVSENIEYLRLKSSRWNIINIEFETYQDFIETREKDDWINIFKSNFWGNRNSHPSYNPLGLFLDLNLGKTVFAYPRTEILKEAKLRLNWLYSDQAIAGQLYNAAQYFRMWPQYNQGFVVYDDFSQYRKLWYQWDDLSWGPGQAGFEFPTDPGDLYNLLIKYIELSRSKVEAEEYVLEQGVEHGAGMVVNYGSILQLAALDYHLARLLGIGFIDPTVSPLWDNPHAPKPDSAKESKDYIYMASYTDAFGKEHIFLTLPTNQRDYRRPRTPKLDGFTYGYKVDSNNNPALNSLFDLDGYLLEGPTPKRLIGLNRKSFPYEPRFQPFFFNQDEWNLIEEETLPVLYGIEYATIDGEPSKPLSFIKPEITSDAGFDSDPAQVRDMLYNSDPNIQLPQNNIKPELIVDQDRYLYTHEETREGTHAYAIYAVDWFSVPSQVSEINKDTEITTKFKRFRRPFPPYNVTAWRVPDTHDPIFSIPQDGTHKNQLRITFDWTYAHYLKYRDAKHIEIYYRQDEPLQVRGRIAVVKDNADGTALITSGPYVRISTDEAKAYPPTLSLEEAGRFAGGRMVVEGVEFEVAEADSGQNFTLKIVLPSETVTYPPDPNDESVTVRSITRYKTPEVGKGFVIRDNFQEIGTDDFRYWSAIKVNNARIEMPLQIQRLDGDVNGGLVLSNKMIKQLSPGRYEIKIQGYPERNVLFALVRPPDGVLWYSGIVRIAGHDYSIVKIDTVKRIIEIYDPQYQNTDNLVFKLEENVFYDTVHIYPGYLLYLDFPIQDKDIIFDNGALSKDIYFALRSVDPDTLISDTDKPVTSILSKSVICKVYNIRKAQQPPVPQTPTFATRPDFFGKSTFTLDFDYRIDKVSAGLPYGILCYRATEQAILNALYTQEKIKTILEILAADKEAKDDFMVNRFRDLVNLGTFDQNGTLLPLNFIDKFTRYGDKQSSFPLPDKSDDFAESNPDALSNMRKALERVFIPLSEAPLLISELNSSLNTTREEPAVIYEETTIRFTDFLLDGGTDNFYFYTAREVDAKHVYSELSVVVGPIFLVNSIPPPAPQIRKILSVPAVADQGPGVRVEINKYLEAEGVTDYTLYRTTDLQKAGIVRMMEQCQEISVEISNESIVLTDLYKGDGVDPAKYYGAPIYYRVIAYREITNEYNKQELIPSQPSAVVSTSLIDARNPDPPTIELLNRERDIASIKWEPTSHNYRYLLYQLQNNGTWKFLDDVTNREALYILVNVPSKDADGNDLFYRFKITVISPAGLLNLTENVFILKPQS